MIDRFCLITKAQRNIIRIPLVVAEVIFDRFSLMTQAQNKVVVPIVSIGLHDMPENRPLTDWNHWFWPKFGFLAQTCAQTTAENDDFHKSAAFVKVLMESKVLVSKRFVQRTSGRTTPGNDPA